jgi:hypothetical protein
VYPAGRKSDDEVDSEGAAPTPPEPLLRPMLSTIE